MRPLLSELLVVSQGKVDWTAMNALTPSPELGVLTALREIMPCDGIDEWSGRFALNLELFSLEPDHGDTTENLPGGSGY